MYRLELKIPPAVLVLLFAFVMWLVSKMAPWTVVQIPGKEWVALALWMAGAVLISAGIIVFFSAKTTANPLAPELSTSLVTKGVYGLSRNPMYAGFLLMLAAWAVFLENLLPVLLLPVFVLYMNRFQIIPEEKILLSKFGEEYAGYLKSVRRWM
jgi:protein-S-isoprenylcysteine O-methyltransferase Ste14